MATSGRHDNRSGKLRVHIFKVERKAESELEVMEGFYSQSPPQSPTSSSLAKAPQTAGPAGVKYLNNGACGRTFLIQITTDLTQNYLD